MKKKKLENNSKKANKWSSIHTEPSYVHTGQQRRPNGEPFLIFCPSSLSSFPSNHDCSPRFRSQRLRRHLTQRLPLLLMQKKWRLLLTRLPHRLKMRLTRPHRRESQRLRRQLAQPWPSRTHSVHLWVWKKTWIADATIAMKKDRWWLLWRIEPNNWRLLGFFILKLFQSILHTKTTITLNPTLTNNLTK